MARQFRIGHTGITWGYTLDRVEPAIRDVAELGYCAYETFGFTIEEYEQKEPGKLAALLEQYGLPLGSVYCDTKFVDPAQADADIEKVMLWARQARALGARAIVLQAVGRLWPASLARSASGCRIWG